MGYGEVFQFTIHYLPFTKEKGERRSPFSHLAEWTGLEPATSAVTGQRSNQLNYHSGIRALTQTLVGADGFEPPTFAL